VVFNLKVLPNNAVGVFGFHGEVGGLVELNAVSLANLFSCGRIIWIFESDVPLMLL
jgi:hypothetical protein